MTAPKRSVVNSLPQLKWGDLPSVPCSDASYKFSHTQSEKRYPYIDGAAHEHVGRDPIQFSATLHFLNTLTLENTKDSILYPDAWDNWREKLLTGGSDWLQHPDLGVVRARPLESAVQVISTQIAGVMVQAAWVETIDSFSDDASITGNGVSVSKLSADVDIQMSVLGIPMPAGAGFPDLLTAIKQIQGRITMAITSAIGKINQVLGVLNYLIDLVRSAPDPTSWALGANLMTLQNELYKLKDTLGKQARPTASRTLVNDTAIATFADSVSNTTAEVLQLNPQYLGKPYFPAGATIKFFK